MTPDQDKNREELIKILSSALASDSEIAQAIAPKPGDCDAKRGKFAYLLLAVGVALLALTLSAMPQLYPVGFGIAFTGFAFVLVWHFDRSFFPETDTFKKVSENAVATAIVFATITFTIVSSVWMGAVVFDVPADRSGEQSANIQAIESSLTEIAKYIEQNAQSAKAPPADTARRRQIGESEREQ